MATFGGPRDQRCTRVTIALLIIPRQFPAGIFFFFPWRDYDRIAETLFTLLDHWLIYEPREVQN